MNVSKKNIYLASVNHYAPPLWHNMASDLRKNLEYPYSYTEIDMDLHLFYSEERKQYHSTFILSKILTNMPDDAKKIIGVTQVDIFIPILTYLFGEAQLGGKGALVSTFRLRNEFYGLPPNENLLYTRTLKEILHELGHTMGLVHCRDYECVMHFSTYVEDIDLKKSQFCSICKKILAGF
jgi:archaemetzincin